MWFLNLDCNLLDDVYVTLFYNMHLDLLLFGVVCELA